MEEREQRPTGSEGSGPASPSGGEDAPTGPSGPSWEGEGAGLGGSGPSWEWQAGGPGEGVPPPGKGHAGHSGRPIERQCVELCPICRTADVLRATIPAEFQEHWHSWQREMLLAARSLIDHYIEHVESERRKAVRVEDIPIE